MDPNAIAPAPVEPISSLIFMTLGAGLLIGIIALFWFLRRSRNREIAGRTLPEALPEVVGLVALACFVMAALTIGYQYQQ